MAGTGGTQWTLVDWGAAVADLADPESVLAALDPEQRQVALATRGPVCVLAGAGTGKTRAIAHRIAYAALTGVVDPGHVLALTFTTRAAGELRARVHQLAGRGAGLDRVQARTFHSAALRQLSHFWPRTVGGRPPTVLDSKVGLLAEVTRRVRAGTSSAELRDVAAEIEWAKVLGVPPDGYPDAAARAGRSAPLAPATVARLYASYEELRRERHLVDFESVLELTAAILAEHPEAAAMIRDRYRYFVVDEYQDVNPLQKLLLDSWAGDRDDVCVVGDPRQTIYSFAGATASYLTGFSADFPGAAVLRLVRNYRSTPQVVALANQLTGLAGRQPLAAQLRPARGAGAGGTGAGGAGAGAAAAGAAGGGTAALVAQRPGGPAVEFAGYPDEQQEASAIATRVAALHAAGAALSQVAVLVRTNAQTLPLEQAFAGLGLPCQLRGTERFFDRPEVRQAVGLLRAAAKSADADLAGAGLAADVRHILAGLGLTPEAPAGRGAARERWESLAALAQLAEDYFAGAGAEGGGGGGLRGFAAELAHRSQIEHAPAMHGVTLASLHAAKGLEWDVVFLAGLAEGTLPIVHAQTDEAIEEERRLLYVGVTRAREQLFLSWPLAWSGGGRRARQPSRFLAGLQPATRRAAALA
jgi:DNA helicase II / ATP-dependent DNA helicase PcrA